MSSSTVEKLRARREQIESIRKAWVGDLWTITGLFTALNRLSDDLPTRSIAEAGRFYTEDFGNVVDEYVSGALDALDESIALLEVRNG